MTATRQQHTPVAYGGKVALRHAVVESFELPRLRVLDAFAGNGRLWRDVAGRTTTKLEVASIDKRSMNRLNMRADNRRVLAAIDLDYFDVIDLDAWGVPAEQVQTIAQRGYRGPIIWTCIAVVFGLMPAAVTESEGIPSEWRDVSSTLFGEHDAASLADRWCSYLTRLGWSHHGWFTTPDTASKLYGVSSVDELPISAHEFAERYHCP